MGTVIAIENLSKKYRIGALTQNSMYKYRSFREVFSEGVKSAFSKKKLFGNKFEDFWALKDVQFSIKAGERVGVIGRNGAGKSTLLKLLSRVTAPSTGRISLKGRVASLLEVGTGFHPELTGRENIFLNGAILGMGRKEIRKKFDEIIAFAEVEKFIDTPVKRYSSGMYVRLAFAVAAHLEPEILIVDEVLAVGDAQFQKKCLSKMETIGKGGSTVLVVSHNMTTVRGLCSRVVLLNGGKLIADGPAPDIIKQYLDLGGSSSGNSNILVFADGAYQRHQGYAFFDKLELLNSVDNKFCLFRNEPLRLRMTFTLQKRVPDLCLGVGIKSMDDSWVLITHNDDYSRHSFPELSPGTYTAEVEIPNFLGPGNYRLIVSGSHVSGNAALFQVEAPCLEVALIDVAGVGYPIYNTGSLMDVRSVWKLKKENGQGEK